ncbi:phenol hydroxylase subunit [uncultured Neptuniibacter sp.]|uniref:phenol hydroxylase subunit n=1 Tax=uncultured Neptuniibacter sp. TaxID=502143 RepID=UPI002631C68B|nr:phenol hydroxylase subunit [uncultured Neptuniibacter sp.]
MTNADLHMHQGRGSQSFDRLVKYIRVRSAKGARFVEFDFAIGDPSLFVELVMPQGAFDHFCEKNEVVHMTTEQMQAVDAEMEKWRYGEETLMAHNHDRATQ